MAEPLRLLLPSLANPSSLALLLLLLAPSLLFPLSLAHLVPLNRVHVLQPPTTNDTRFTLTASSQKLLPTTHEAPPHVTHMPRTSVEKAPDHDRSAPGSFKKDENRSDKGDSSPDSRSSSSGGSLTMLHTAGTPQKEQVASQGAREGRQGAVGKQEEQEEEEKSVSLEGGPAQAPDSLLPRWLARPFFFVTRVLLRAVEGARRRGGSVKVGDERRVGGEGKNAGSGVSNLLNFKWRMVCGVVSRLWGKGKKEEVKKGRIWQGAHWEAEMSRRRKGHRQAEGEEWLKAGWRGGSRAQGGPDAVPVSGYGDGLPGVVQKRSAVLPGGGSALKSMMDEQGKPIVGRRRAGRASVVGARWVVPKAQGASTGPKAQLVKRQTPKAPGGVCDVTVQDSYNQNGYHHFNVTNVGNLPLVDLVMTFVEDEAFHPDFFWGMVYQNWRGGYTLTETAYPLVSGGSLSLGYFCSRPRCNLKLDVAAKICRG